MCKTECQFSEMRNLIIIINKDN